MPTAVLEGWSLMHLTLVQDFLCCLLGRDSVMILLQFFSFSRFVSGLSCAAPASLPGSSGRER